MKTLPIGEIINQLMDKKAPKDVAFKTNTGRWALYEIKVRYPLFLGWTNEYGKDD